MKAIAQTLGVSRSAVRERLKGGEPAAWHAISSACRRMAFPNLVYDLFRVWSYWLGFPDRRTSRLKLDCGMLFSDTVPVS